MSTSKAGIEMLDARQQNQSEPKPATDPNVVHKALLESASSQAIVQVITIWHDRLQLISVFATFFTGIDSSLLGLSRVSGSHTSVTIRVMDATLVGALIFHAASAILAYIACFVLIRYNLNETAHQRATVGDGTDTSIISDIFLQQFNLANANSASQNTNANPNPIPTRHAADLSSAESQSGQGQGHRAGPSTSSSTTRPHSHFAFFSSSTRGPHFLPTISHSGTPSHAAGSLSLPPIITHPSELFQAVQKSLGLGVFVSRVHPFKFNLKRLSLVSICTCGRRPGRHHRTGTGSSGGSDDTGAGSDPDLEMDHRELMRLLSRCHTACSMFILVGFVLQVTGVLAFVWVNYVRAVSVWGSGCVAFVVVVGFAALH